MKTLFIALLSVANAQPRGDVVLSCNSKGSASTSINAGAQDYFATLTIPATDLLFTISATYRITTGPSCSPSVESKVVGNGAGSHQPHQQSVEDGRSYQQNINDTDTSFDWIFAAETSTACDYEIHLDYHVTCGPPPPPPPPPPTPSPSGIPTWLTWWATINSTQVTNSGQTAHATGVAAWDTAMGSTVNKTAWVGQGDSFVADFNQQIVYNTEGTVCQYTCQMEGGENSCDSAMDGEALCGYDYETRSKLMGNVTLPNGQVARHFFYNDPLGPISMATHDLYVSVKTGLPLRFKASYHPFGKFVENVTSDYTDFQTTAPPSKYFEVTQIKYCVPGNSQQCANSLRRVRQLGLQLGVPVLQQQLAVLAD